MSSLVRLRAVRLRSLAAAACCGASFLAGCLVFGQEPAQESVPLPVLNPFVSKGAKLRPLATREQEPGARRQETTPTHHSPLTTHRSASVHQTERAVLTTGAPSRPVPIGSRIPTAEPALPLVRPAAAEEEQLAPIVPASEMPPRPSLRRARLAQGSAAVEEAGPEATVQSAESAGESLEAKETGDRGQETGDRETAEPQVLSPSPLPSVLLHAPGAKLETPSAEPVTAEPAEPPAAVQPELIETAERTPQRVRATQFQELGGAQGLLIQNTTRGQETGDRGQEPPPTTHHSPLTTDRLAQGARSQEPAPAAPAALPEGAPFEMIRESGALVVQVRRSLLLRTQKDVYRTATVDESICEIVQFTPRELSIIGRSTGSTHVTFWFDDPAMQPVTYVVEVKPDAAEVKKEEDKFRLLEDVLNEMFPDSKIKLSLVADKVIVRGQAKDSEEASQIMTVLRAQAGYRVGVPGAPWNGGLGEGQAAQVLSDTATGSTRRTNYQIVNMLRVPGVQQVALRVKIAELNRTAARNFGLDIQGTIDVTDSSKILLNSLSATTNGQAPPILFNIDGDDISIGLNALQQHGVVKLLSEPTLVTMSGRPATFIAGGEFAVPTAVGFAGPGAITTDFRAFGAIISFLPTVVDKDRVRLEVAPEFSQINEDLASTASNIPGLNVRAATTTVEMREGQTLAIAGLLEDTMTANNAGDLPFLQRLIGRRSVTRNETELIILVTPELVHPLEPEEVPPLPGFDVTEPTNCEFYLHGDLEGNPTRDHRSTVWPRLRQRYRAGGPAMTSGPFGHGQ